MLCEMALELNERWNLCVTGCLRALVRTHSSNYMTQDIIDIRGIIGCRVIWRCTPRLLKINITKVMHTAIMRKIVRVIKKAVAIRTCTRIGTQRKINTTTRLNAISAVQKWVSHAL